MTRFDLAALAVLGLWALCYWLGEDVSWLGMWPNAWEWPLNDIITGAFDTVAAVLKPLMRLIAAVLAIPMDVVGYVLHALPWTVWMAGVAALGWALGGGRLAFLGGAGMAAVAFSGYWTQAMNTLSLVLVSVVLAMGLGLMIGIFAFRVKRARPTVEAILDAMQTIPTFAYLTPLLLLFGFGPVVGLIASVIYAAPPMARNTLLGLSRVDPEIREAAQMSGASRRAQLWQIELPAAIAQIKIGVNQSLMAALSMVIIAAVIGGFDDIGWEVLLTMRKAQFGKALLAGLVIVIFAIVLDRYSSVSKARAGSWRGVWIIAALGALLAVALPSVPPAGALDGVVAWVDGALSTFTATHGAALDQVKNNAMFYLLLPLRIGLDEAVLPFTWGFAWTPIHTMVFFALCATLAAGIAWRLSFVAGVLVMIAAMILHTGIAQLPWPPVALGVGVLAWRAQGARFAAIALGLFALIAAAGLYERALLSVYLSGTAVVACVAVGGALGVLAAYSRIAWALLRPLCDLLQTIPLFVFLIPVLMFFQIGEFSAFLAICAYAIVPMIRYTRHGIQSLPPDLVESAKANGANTWQTLLQIRAPYAAPVILLGVNQVVLYAFAMLVIASLIGTTGLGQSIYLALGQGDIGMGLSAGGAMAILAFVADRILQGFARERRRALGL